MALGPADKLGDLLVKAGLIDEMQLRSALGHQRRWGGKLGKCLVDLELISEEAMLKFLSEKFHIGAVDLTRSHIAPQTFKMVPEAVARKYEVVPVVVRDQAGKKTLVLAMSDPSDLQAVDEIQFLTNARVEPVLATDSAIMKVLEHYGDYSPEMLQQQDRFQQKPSERMPPQKAQKPAAGKQPPQRQEQQEQILTLDEGIDIEPDEDVELIKGEVTMLKTRAETPETPAVTQRDRPMAREKTLQEQTELIIEPAQDYLGSESPPEIEVSEEDTPRIGSGTERIPQPPPVREERRENYFVPPDLAGTGERKTAKQDTEDIFRTDEEPQSEFTQSRDIQLESMKPPDFEVFGGEKPLEEQEKQTDQIDIPEESSEEEGGMELAGAHEFIPQYNADAVSQPGIQQDGGGIVHPKLLEKPEVARAEGHIKEENQHLDAPDIAAKEEFSIETQEPKEIPWEEPEKQDEQVQEQWEPPELEIPPLTPPEPPAPPELQTRAPEEKGEEPPDLAPPPDISGPPEVPVESEQLHIEPPPLGDEMEPPSIFEDEPPSLDFLRPQNERDIVLPPPEGFEFVPQVKLPFEEPIPEPAFDGDLAERPDTPDFASLEDKVMPDIGLSEKEIFFNVQKEAETDTDDLQAGELERVPTGPDQSGELDAAKEKIEQLEDIGEDFLDAKTVKAQMEKILTLEGEVRKKEYQFDELLNLMMKKELGEITSEVFMKELTTMKLKMEKEKKEKNRK